MNFVRLGMQQQSASLVVKASNHSQQMNICIAATVYMLGALGTTLHKQHPGSVIAPGTVLYSSEQQLLEGSPVPPQHSRPCQSCSAAPPHQRL